MNKRVKNDNKKADGECLTEIYLKINRNAYYRERERERGVLIKLHNGMRDTVKEIFFEKTKCLFETRMKTKIKFIFFLNFFKM